jgi:hypothetical protein
MVGGLKKNTSVRLTIVGRQSWVYLGWVGTPGGPG